ncbi:hypothetical protein FACS1894168_2960 [Deltaproteobacteria bacterium]|nr:hypothetical protein FACS1894168_2960 [Deltaproteobacteria bacterium]
MSAEPLPALGGAVDAAGGIGKFGFGSVIVAGFPPEGSATGEAVPGAAEVADTLPEVPAAAGCVVAEDLGVSAGGVVAFGAVVGGVASGAT